MDTESEPIGIGQIKILKDEIGANSWRQAVLPLPKFLELPQFGQKRLLFIADIVISRDLDGSPQLGFDFEYEENEENRLTITKLGGLSTVYAIGHQIRFFDYFPSDYDLQAWDKVRSVWGQVHELSAHELMPIPSPDIAAA